MNNVFQAAAELQEICESNQWKFCFIGGLALQRWGEPRQTVDVDLSLFAGFGKEQPFIEKLLKHFDAKLQYLHRTVGFYCCDLSKVSDWISL